MRSHAPRSPGVCPKSSKLSQSLPEETVSPHCSSLSLNSCKKICLMISTLSPILSVQHVAPMLLHSSTSAPFPQTVPFPSQPSSGLSRLLAKSPGDGDYNLRPLKVVSLMNASSAEQHSLKIETSALRAVSKPGIIQASLLYILNLEGWW